jgi:N-acetylglucosamine PTS system EIICBA or EIICB component
MVTMDLLDSRLGFGFSAGLFDYVLNFNKATHPWILFPVGALYGLLYYGLFRYFILRFDLKTPGREADEAPAIAHTAGDGDTADLFIAALGGAANLREVAACTTRLRLTLDERGRADAAALRRLGARGTVNVGDHGLQVVIGPIADQVAGDIRARLAAGARPARQAPRLIATPEAPGIVAALGGAGNVERVESAAGRVLVTVRDMARVDQARLRAMFQRGIAVAGSASLHLLHADAPFIVAQIAPALA